VNSSRRVFGENQPYRSTRPDRTPATRQPATLTRNVGSGNRQSTVMQDKPAELVAGYGAETAAKADK
jgi:hypothetical protein